MEKLHIVQNESGNKQGVKLRLLCNKCSTDQMQVDNLDRSSRSLQNGVFEARVSSLKTLEELFEETIYFSNTNTQQLQRTITFERGFPYKLNSQCIHDSELRTRVQIVGLKFKS